MKSIEHTDRTKPPKIRSSALSQWLMGLFSAFFHLSFTSLLLINDHHHLSLIQSTSSDYRTLFIVVLRFCLLLFAKPLMVNHSIVIKSQNRQ